MGLGPVPVGGTLSLIQRLRLIEVRWTISIFNLGSTRPTPSSKSHSGTDFFCGVHRSCSSNDRNAAPQRPTSTHSHVIITCILSSSLVGSMRPPRPPGHLYTSSSLRRQCISHRDDSTWRKQRMISSLIKQYTQFSGKHWFEL